VSAETHRARIAEFIGREWHRLVGAVRSWIDDAADRDAEDVVQDVLERMLDVDDEPAPVADVSAYVWRSLRNRVVDLYRRPRRTAPLPDGEIADAAEGALEQIVRGDDVAEMLDAIEELPPAQREVLVATELEGRGFRELAAEWKVPLGTLLARKHRAVRALRETLTGGDS
jgi:RNA polymerase sigma-70 factor (ECF subfamily)